MPPKRDTTRNSQSDSSSITDLTINNLRRLIREEVKSTIKDEVDTLSARLGNIEQQMQILTDLKATVNAVETSITHTSERIDDIFRNSLPALARHITEVATGLALQTMLSGCAQTQMDAHYPWSERGGWWRWSHQGCLCQTCTRPSRYTQRCLYWFCGLSPPQ